MKREIVSTALVLILLLMMFSSLPLVSAVYTVEEHYMPPESDDSKPVCAMKTYPMVQGLDWFYIPNLNVHYIKVEFWSTEYAAIGDRAGGVSPYSSISSWSDEKVDLYDVTFLTSRYGSKEGGSNWDYLAEVCWLDSAKQVNLYDAVTVIKYYGQQGSWYQYSLENIVVKFNTGQVLTPDANGFVQIPTGATSYGVVNTQKDWIVAMVTFWGPSEPPIAYSTTFEFTVPSDDDNEVWYYVLARMYVPSEVAGKEFYLFPESVDDWIRNVKINNILVYSGGHPACQPPACVSLGVLGKGYHLLEFEYGEQWVGGALRFHVATASGQPAWLSRFRIYVPNYSEDEYRYTVTTTSWCSMKDDYFLIGYADDYIDDVHVDGLVWQDWMWDMGAYGAIYAWGDGFCYPLGNLENNIGLNAYSISFEFGEIWVAGLLDFQYISWTHQQEKMGKPGFYCKAENPVVLDSPLQIDCSKIYGGSEWHSEAGTSWRSISATHEISVYKPPDNEDPEGHDAVVRFTISLVYLDYESPKGTMTDFAIALNMTHLCVHLGESNKPASLDAGFEIPDSENYGIHVYAPDQALTLGQLEYSEGRSFVDNNFVVNVAADVGYVVFAACVGQYLEFGATMLASLAAGRTLATLCKYTNDQQLPQSGVVTSSPTYKRLWTNGYSYIPDFDILNPPTYDASRSDILFLQIHSGDGAHCGAMKITVVSKLWFTDWGTYPIGVSYGVKLTTTFIVPYFVKI